MDNKYIVIITGDLASGKTSYGIKISNTLGIPFFSKDKIKEVLYDSISGGNDLDYESKRKIGSTSYDIFYYIIEEQMKSGMPLVAESNFTEESIPIIKELLTKYNYKCVTVKFTGDLHVLHDRFIKREYSDERHSGLFSNGKFDNYEVFESRASVLRNFKIDDNEIIVDTTDFNTVDYDSIINYIKGVVYGNH